MVDSFAALRLVLASLFHHIGQRSEDPSKVLGQCYHCAATCSIVLQFPNALPDRWNKILTGLLSLGGMKS
jgi:hypothetical protein